MSLFLSIPRKGTETRKELWPPPPVCSVFSYLFPARGRKLGLYGAARRVDPDVFSYLFPARGRKLVHLYFVSKVFPVFSYLFPARGRKLIEVYRHQLRGAVFSYLFPARGRKPYYFAFPEVHFFCLFLSIPRKGTETRGFFYC